MAFLQKHLLKESTIGASIITYTIWGLTIKAPIVGLGVLPEL